MPDRTSSTLRRFALAALLPLAACMSAPPLPVADAPLMALRTAAPDATAASTASQGYRLSVGDTIEIKLFYNPELNEQQVIRPDGRITMQLIGELQAAGLTSADLEALVRQRYTGILRTPVPAVFVRRYVPQKVYVGGHVNQPAAVPVEGPVTLMQAVFQVGGFKFNAEKRNVLVFRNNGLPDASVMVVNLDQQLTPGSVVCEPLPQCAADPATGVLRQGDVVLQPNDVVYVPQTSIGQLAQYMDENIGKIIPLFRNMGVNLYYQLNRNLKTTTTVVPAP